jgi:hypothetical protein
MAFRFWLLFDPRAESLRPPRERLSQIFHKPLLHISDGIPSETMLDMPKLVASDSSKPY